MGIVLAGFLALAVIVAVVWALSLQKSAASDRAEIARQEAEQEARQRAAEEEAKLMRKGVRLHCMSCGADFTGPLPDEGCPQCHIRSLVVTEAEFRKTQPENQSNS